MHALKTSHIRRTTLALTTLGVCALLSGCTAGTNQPAAPGNTPAATTSASPTAALTKTTLQVPKQLQNTAPFNTPRTLLAPKGWTVALYARVDGARLATWTPDKKLLISRPDAGDIQLLTPGNNPAAIPKITTIISGLTKPHGMAFDGNTLYIAESNRVTASTYTAGRLSNTRTVVDNLPDGSTGELRGVYAHALKSVAVGNDSALYISVGSTGNASAEDRAANPERASILRVKDGKTTVYAHGVRNGTGLAVDPDGAVWTAVNNRDQIAYPYPNGALDQGEVDKAYVNDHPLEPIAKLTPGRDLGWPYCNPDPDTTPGDLNSTLTYTDRPFVRDQQLNTDGSKLDCAKLPNVEQGLPAHSAPLGLAFAADGVLPDQYGAGALVGIHGSWNRNPPRAPEVAFLPWRDGTLRAPQTLIGGFQLADGSRWGRPVAAVTGPDNAIYITDDQAGAVYRVIPAR